MRPYAPANRCTKVFAGHVHTFEKNLLRCDWSPDGSKVRTTAHRLPLFSLGGAGGGGGPRYSARVRVKRCRAAAPGAIARAPAALLARPPPPCPSHPLRRSPPQVTAGSGDRCVYIWNSHTRNLMYKLPGHSGSVNECVFHPKEPIIGSASSDKTLYLGELAV